MSGGCRCYKDQNPVPGGDNYSVVARGPPYIVKDLSKSFRTMMVENVSLGIRSKQIQGYHPEESGSLGPGSKGRMDEDSG